MILVDSNPLMALVDNRDPLNPIAVADLKRLASRPLFLASSVLVEVCFALPHPAHRQRLRQIIAHLELQPCPPMPEEQLWAEVFDWMARYAEHEPDWTDGHLAVLCGHQKRFKVWTYDREFRLTWRRPDGSRIPLAVST